MNVHNKKKKVYVGMSGGVDSSVVAGMMKEAGYDVVGVTMCFNISHPKSKKPSCCGADGIQDAKRAAYTLGIAHYVFNFAKEIDQHVIANFTSEYLSGRTPNPCVQCNRYLKFGALFDRIREIGGDYLATGHYARIEYDKASQRFELKKGKDTLKDQTYFLYSVKKKILPFVLFPLGNLTKQQVRILARKYKLPNAEKPASQDICFVPDGGYQKFIEDRIEQKMIVPGPFKDSGGNIVGQHKGIARYTIGQRDKLGIALGRPVYVYRIDKAANTVYVGDVSNLYARSLIAGQLNFLTDNLPRNTISIKAKIRYNHPEVKARLTLHEDGHALVEFKEPQKSITPGQSVVFYQDDVVLGGGVIKEAAKI
ncbi:MAG TPA: tRNA 2-thiouridine(34) synthase MnmA [Candidatus Omnitrophota bacterium]|nr:tRNA 2-thiouridine(34) synthase MnmA [Candidatus Omnitrophota bacterium]HPD84680.1 tRNA 2-thiouridine(34) synthase MnmA [Candidatus Omnitrophota bacterium]HRZ03538.1 tRNA 2-thiouridine(34) synthase MnmA [Candidatus Omnitrophota bacterium]